ARSAASPVQPWRAPDTTCSWWTVSLRTSKRSTATGSPSSARAWARAEGGAVTPDWLGGDLSLVLLAVKSHHSAEALAVLAPRLAAAGTIVSLQNGLSEELIAQAVGAERTVGCLVNWAADWAAPGRILHGGHGAFVLGELDGRITPRVKELASLLSAVEQTPVTDNIWGYKWAKLIYGALLFGTAVVDAHVYEVVERSPG